MTLLDLRKKYVLLFDAVPDEIDLFMRRKVLELLDMEIKTIEFRVSQLEKEEDEYGFNLRPKETIKEWHRRHGEIDALRGVIGK